MLQPISTTIADGEAGECFADLIDRVSAGEEVVITRRGAAVVRMVPAGRDVPAVDRQAVVQAMRELAGRHRLDGLRLRDLIAEGRR
jgi:antitoxin (DNA-binding transcriptional repressor) of toxin-antitoxin stability system